MAQQAQGPPKPYLMGSLRSKLVAKLTDLHVSTLQSWHSTGLQMATRQPGARGSPRYYSWVDYQRLCVVSSLREQEVPTQRIRSAVKILDVLFPGWWEMSLKAYHGKVLGSYANTHVTIRDNFDVIVDVEGGQTTFRDMMGSEVEKTGDSLASALADLEEKGSLFRKHQYKDAVVMKPDLNAAQPTIVNTSLETFFIAAAVHETSVEYVSQNYCIDKHIVERAIEFEAAS